MVYWTMKPYLGFGTSGSGFIVKDLEWWRNDVEWCFVNDSMKTREWIEKEKEFTKLQNNKVTNLPNLTDWNKEKRNNEFSDNFLTNFSIPIRYTNTYGIQNYLKKKFDFYEYKKLTWEEFLQEKVFLGLRTTRWVEITKEIESVLNMDKLEQFVKDGYLKLEGWSLAFTDKWFDVYNYVITEILNF
jgi:coproporphyrinogen III oxidase-like Fe-S oxidoreductase